MNHRRQFLTKLGAGMLANPLNALAQPPGAAVGKLWRAGFLAPRHRPASMDADYIGGFVRGMRELGYTEGKNLQIDWRFADGDFARLGGLAAELVQSRVDVIVAAGPQAIGAAQKATSAIPIVMGVTGDPVRDGFVKSLRAPGGNITGTALLSVDIMPKRLEMLLSLAPTLTRVAVMFNPANASHVAGVEIVQAVAQNTKAKILPVEVKSADGILAAFARMKREKAGAVIVQADSVFQSNMRQIAELAMKNRMLSATAIREYVDAGCLLSYGASFTDSFRKAAIYVDKIFRGAAPANLPVEQPTIFELFINGKTVKALGLKIPHSLLILADKVIE